MSLRWENQSRLETGRKEKGNGFSSQVECQMPVDRRCRRDGQVLVGLQPSCPGMAMPTVRSAGIHTLSMEVSCGR